jgi:hypothetical protein
MEERKLGTRRNREARGIPERSGRKVAVGGIGSAQRKVSCSESKSEGGLCPIVLCADVCRRQEEQRGQQAL